MTIDLNGTSYLFDISGERLIAAWCLSAGKTPGERDAARLRGAPSSGGPEYQRGHAIAHSLGGREDTNLVPQLRKLNMGAFRKLEHAAVQNPGALYFTYWIYNGDNDQIPSAVEQGLFVPGRRAMVVKHEN